MRFPQRPPAARLAQLKRDELQVILSSRVAPVLPDGRYLHWNDLRNRSPPPGLTVEHWWLAQKLARTVGSVILQEFTGIDDQPFWFCRLDAIDRVTHQLDRRDAAKEIIKALGDAASQHQYRTDQLIEEAISSSVLEGAKLTTRAQAKALIRDGRAPQSRGERMVVNNYQAMLRLIDLRDRQLSVEDLLEIHAILGEGALDGEAAAGRLRRLDEDVRVEDAATGETWFVPPPADHLPERLEKMLGFANDGGPGPFVHPVIRAIVLHFWLAYLHPFVDGNGRMARALFYWQMLRAGYDFAQYLSISGPIDRSPRSYYLAFAHTETDGGDLTYFLLHQLHVLEQATEELLEHLRDRATRLRTLSAAISGEALNLRQQAVLSYLVRNPSPGATVTGHARSHGVSYLTARKDLQQLETEGFVRRVRVGRGDRYYPSPRLATRFNAR
jgi:Fic family protein